MKTMLAIPSFEQVAAGFANSLATLDREGECMISFKVGSLVFQARNELALEAFKCEADCVLWIDSDMVFSRDLLVRMQKHMREGADIVCGLAFRRAKPFTPVIYKRFSVNGGEIVSETYEDYPRDSVFEVEACGFGCVMTRTDVLLDVAAKYNTLFAPMGHVGEDLAFCVRARECGYKILCDSSIKLGHVGHHIIDEEFYDAYRLTNTVSANG